MSAQNATVVLVHGAWADGSYWQNVIFPLRSLGVDVICAPIPLTSLTDDIASLQNIGENQRTRRAGWTCLRWRGNRRACR